MRLHASDPDAKNVRVVMLDGKIVPTPVEFDTAEGWVISVMPVMHDEKMIQADDSVNIDEDNQNEHGFETVKRHGKVEVFFHDTPVAD